MKKPKHVRRTRFFRRHIASTLIILTAIIACAATLTYFTATSHQDTQKAEQASIKSATAMDEVIAGIVARKAEELKAKQATDAKDTAEKSIRIDEEAASSVDATTCNTAKKHVNPSAIDVLVNKKHCLQPLNFTPSNLVDIGNGFLLVKEAADQFNLFMAAARAAGILLNVTSSYRSYSNQVSTYAHWVGVSGADGADTYSARPGYSEHQTGLAFDIASNGCALSCFGSSPAYNWVSAHAPEFGFIQRYHAGYEATTGYSAEEWHYRYVGTTIALDMQTKNIKTLEQYWNMPGGNYY